MKTKDQKRSEAIERQAEYDKLSATQKYVKLDKGGFKATKQRKRLLKEASNDKAKKA